VIGFSTDGASSKTGCIRSFATPIAKSNASSPTTYHVQCVAQRANLALGEAIRSSMDDAHGLQTLYGSIVYRDLDVMKILCDVVRSLRLAKCLQKKMRKQCPLYIKVSWQSLAGVFHWLDINYGILNNARRRLVLDHLESNSVGLDNDGTVPFWIVVRCLKNVMQQFKDTIKTVQARSFSVADTCNAFTTVCEKLESQFNIVPKSPPGSAAPTGDLQHGAASPDMWVAHGLIQCPISSVKENLLSAFGSRSLRDGDPTPRYGRPSHELPICAQSCRRSAAACHQGLRPHALRISAERTPDADYEHGRCRVPLSCRRPRATSTSDAQVERRGF
jgi:hypothetical protein